MTSRAPIDTAFDFRRDTPEGGDPDALSPTLRRYHQLLWSKPLPIGSLFSLDDSVPGGYLHHRSGSGEFWMRSDSVVHTYRSWSRHGLPAITAQVDPERLDRFSRLACTIGGMMLFPSWTGVRHWSINQARGMLTSIADRMDLTLECIRRHYGGDESPMTRTLARYDDYFALFGGFDGYVRFFLLDDLVVQDLSAVRFHLPFDDFARRVATPTDVVEYEQYMASSMRFVEARNRRIERWALDNLAAR